MPGHDIVVVGASAGGVEALIDLTSRLPRDLPAALFVVLHLPSNGVSVLPEILNHHGVLPAVHPRDGQPIETGYIYVALPGNQLLVEKDWVRVVPGPSINGHRPAIDPLFRSASLAYGPRVVGIVLSGTGDDGTSGLLAIKQRGGIAIVQDPKNALFTGMPQSAIEHVPVDDVLPISKIGPALVRLVSQPVTESAPTPSPDLELDVASAALDSAASEKIASLGKPSTFSCPECGGVLQELDQGELIQFRCRTGHVFSQDSLESEQSQMLETALWTALRALEEKVSLARRVASHVQARGHKLTAGRFEEGARTAAEQAELVRRALLITRQLTNSELSEARLVESEIETSDRQEQSGNGRS